MTRISLIIGAVVVTLLSLMTAPATAADTVLHYPTCRNTQGSRGPVPCIWDGQTQGDRNGRSFRVLSYDPTTGPVRSYLNNRTCDPSTGDPADNRDCRILLPGNNQPSWYAKNGTEITQDNR